MAVSVPQPVLIEFCQRLAHAANDDWELLVPVVRGSVLMRHWFGDRARPAADLDLECFQKEHTGEQLEELVEMYDGYDEIPQPIYGPWAQYADLVDYGKAVCRDAAQSSTYYQWNAERYPQPVVEFTETTLPAEGASLWVYGTPGQRYHVGWRTSRTDLIFEAEGVLQIDIASCGSYQVEELAVIPIEFETIGGEAFEIPGYSQDAMLAAKLSWLLRGLERQQDDNDQPTKPLWSGEPKDLFDAHLLLTAGDIDAERFQESLTVFCRDDSIMWSSLLALVVDVPEHPLEDEDFSNWEDFANDYPDLLEASPGRLLQEVADKVTPLLGDFYAPNEEQFLSQPRIAAYDLLVLAGVEEPPSDDMYLVYADWLEERGDPRAEFLRTLIQFSDATAGDEIAALRRQLSGMLNDISLPWLQRLCGSTGECRELLAKITAES